MNRYIKLKILSAFFILLTMLNACTDGFEELNTRNDLVEEASVDYILTRFQVTALIQGSFSNAQTLGNYCGLSVRGDNRPFINGEDNTIWDNTYSNYVRNLSDIIHRTSNDPELVNKNAIARILKAWVFSVCTDTYGDIPYFESGLPIDQAVYRPKYDEQKSIYEDLFKELKESTAQLDASKESFSSADILYGGDVEKWRKFANSLRLRLAIRVRYVDPDMARANISDLEESDLIISNDENAVAYSSTEYDEYKNYEYKRLENSADGISKEYFSKTLVDLLQDNYDPRLKLFADTAEATFPGAPGYEDVESFGYRGHPLLGFVPVEEKYAYGSGSVSKCSDFYMTPVAEKPIIKAPEVYFLLSEAALSGIKGSTQDAQIYYKKGIGLAMAWAVDFYNKAKPQMHDVVALQNITWGEQEINDYIEFHELTELDVVSFVDTATVSVLTGSFEEKLEMIINQKMISFWPMMENEGWAEWRRTGYPRVLVGSDGDYYKGVSPRRMIYPTAESNVNKDNLNEAVERMGGIDDKLQKVWWDKNPLAPHKHPGTVESRDTPWI